MKTKQVIVMRKDLGMRKGKMISQGAHASLGALLSLFDKREYTDGRCTYRCSFNQGGILDCWLNGLFTKVCVYVNSEEELLDIYRKAKDEHMPVKLITDCGLTEFHNEPTNTCLCIGPYVAEKIDKITGNLPLL